MSAGTISDADEVSVNFVRSGDDGSGVGTVTSVATGGIATGGTITSTGTVTVAKASTAEVTTGTNDTNALTPLALAGSSPALVAPILSAGGTTTAGSIKFKEGTDNGTNAVTLSGPVSTADVTVTLPAATDTLVGKATTDTLTNKTLTTPTMSAPVLSAGGTTTAGSIKFKEGTDNGTNTVTLIGPAATADVTVTLPAATTTLAAAGANSDITSITGLTTDLTVAQGGTGTGTFTDGGILLGSGTDPITAMAVADFTEVTVAAGDSILLGDATDSGNIKRDTVQGILDLASATYDDNKIQSNIALLGFKCAVNGSLAKYNLQDQIIDEYEDATGIDASASTNEVLSAGVYYGVTTSTPSVTEDADSTGTDGDYTWYKWTDTAATGSYETDTTQEHEYLIVGGGGSGGRGHAGGGGGGGVLAATGLSLTGGNEYTVTVGAGGASVSTNTGGIDGNDSILSGTGITTLTAGGGGGGGHAGGDGGGGRATNGNGGGGAYNSSGGAGNGAGFAGGSGTGGAPQYGGAGGGGAGAVGYDGTGAMTGTAGDGGAGVANDIIETGTDVYYAGGGGGSTYTDNSLAGAGGNGGGGRGGGSSTAGTAGTTNTGGGGGGIHSLAATSGAGGSGIVILRRLTTVTNTGADLTLQSTDTTAMTEPNYADMVMLMENAEGTATLNTDIKGYISEDSGVTFTQGTLVDEGTWGANKKIVAFHDLDISAQSGTSMCYKITTHNQSAGSKETKIHATSIGWKA
jgi:hypothetical protein